MLTGMAVASRWSGTPAVSRRRTLLCPGTRAHEPDVPSGSGRVPGRADVRPQPVHTDRVDTFIALVGAAVPIVVGAVVLLRSDQRTIGWLLVAHGLCIGLFLGSPSEPANARPAMVADQLLAGTWTLMFVWLVLIGYLLPTGHVASSRQRRWIQLGAAVFDGPSAVLPNAGARRSHP